MPPRIAAACRPVSMPSPAASTTARRTVGSPMNRASSPIAFEPPPTQAMARSGSRPSTAEQLGRGLVADPALEVAHDRRVRVRAHGRTQHVVGRLDVGHPVAHRLVDRVLERRRPRRHRAHLGAQRAHPQDVGALALDVLGAHVDDAREVEQRTGRRGRHAVLAGAGLGDDPGLAEPPGEQSLAEGVVDLVRPGVGQVLALEVEPEVRDARRACAVARETRRLVRGPPRPGDRHGTGPSGGRRNAPAGRAARPRRRVVAEGVVGGLELLERGHQRLRDVAATEIALHPPPAGAVGIEETGMDGCRTERRRWGGRRGRRAPA